MMYMLGSFGRRDNQTDLRMCCCVCWARLVAVTTKLTYVLICTYIRNDNTYVFCLCGMPNCRGIPGSCYAHIRVEDAIFLDTHLAGERRGTSFLDVTKLT